MLLFDETDDCKILRLVRNYLEENSQERELYNEEPPEPRPQDCCGQSCTPCVFDLHSQDLTLWAKECGRSIVLPDGNTLYESVYGKEEESGEEKEGVFSPNEYRKFAIIGITKMSETTNLIRFDVDGKRLNIPLGAHLVARCKSPKGHVISRQYSPSAVGRNYFEVPIKVYGDGRFTPLTLNWEVGTVVDWRGPFQGEWSGEYMKIPSLLVVCGGTGIAPIVRILDALFDSDAETRIRLVYCISSPSELLFREKLSKWAANWNCKITVFMTKEQEGENTTKLPYLIPVKNKRFIEEDFEGEVEQFGSSSSSLHTLVCGSITLEKDVINFAIRNGIPLERRIRFT